MVRKNKHNFIKPTYQSKEPKSTERQKESPEYDLFSGICDAAILVIGFGMVAAGTIWGYPEYAQGNFTTEVGSYCLAAVVTGVCGMVYGAVSIKSGMEQITIESSKQEKEKSQENKRVLEREKDGEAQDQQPKLSKKKTPVIQPRTIKVESGPENLPSAKLNPSAVLSLNPNSSQEKERK